MSRRAIESIKDALKMISCVEESSKEPGLRLLQKVLIEQDKQLSELGYDQVIFKELMKLVQFESGQTLTLSLDILEAYYFNQSNLWDELAETIIYRVARTSDSNTCIVCLEKISSLIDKFDERIGKHSKQLLKLVDLNDNVNLNPILTKILLKLQDKLPKRREVSQ